MKTAVQSDTADTVCCIMTLRINENSVSDEMGCRDVQYGRVSHTRSAFLAGMTTDPDWQLEALQLNE